MVKVYCPALSSTPPYLIGGCASSEAMGEAYTLCNIEKGKLRVTLGPLLRYATCVHSFVGPFEAVHASSTAKKGQSYLPYMRVEELPMSITSKMPF